MTRRGRALVFGAAALACAALAASVAGGYRSDVEAQYGPLRPVVVTVQRLAAGRVLRSEAAEALEVRQVPERFVPSDGLATPAAAIGRAPQGAIPAGSYLLDSHLADPDPPRTEGDREAGPGRTPVELAVSAAGALGRPSAGRPSRVDVVVTTEPGPGRGPGRTYVAAGGVRLLGLRSAEDEALEPGPSPAGWIATLALTRGQALRLIQAESFARQVRIIGR